ncbi:alpha/beta-hydrolase [Gonapodya prolifera JEL478]|uniref:Alpha/beta-hydrolase n=1 Tax=Gonapodya prolifera (strain JEL478) TaxID=1344416 RepID=A0A139B0T4_GONPJ|nr:alpha/beta-hydrolase [Gonapodya prolifera JEL478]|eukprot:KXS22577.1 alpha/beta-hydrolase [Gonapodya prolifera JEL478]
MVELTLAQKLFRAQMCVMGYLFPDYTAKRVVDMFGQTQKRPIPEAEKQSEALARVKKFELAPMTEDFFTPSTSYECQTWLQGYEYGPEDGGKGTAVLIHGYSGRATQFYALIPLLAARGYRVIALDMPACGASPGDIANPVTFSNALEALIRANSIHPNILIGHSMGALVSIFFASLCRRSPYLDKLERIAVVGTQDSAVDFLNLFGEMVGVSGTAAAELLLPELQKRTADLDVKTIVTSQHIKNINVPVLFIHDSADKEVNVSNSRNIVAVAQAIVDERQKAREGAGGADDEFAKFEFRYVETEGLGHQRILRDAKVINMIVDFVEEIAGPPRDGAGAGVAAVTA